MYLQTHQSISLPEPKYQFSKLATSIVDAWVSLASHESVEMLCGGYQCSAVCLRIEHCADAGEDDEEKEQQLDLDLHLALGKPHPDGTRPPAPLTANQRRIMQALVDKHGTDVEAMAKDNKRNKMLHTVGTLKRMLQALHLHKEGTRVQWQQPKHKLW